MVFLITGKAKAGKTTYGKRLSKELENIGYNTKTVDGDIIREMYDNKDFSLDGRIENLRIISDLAKKEELGGNIVIVSAIAPYKKWRDMMRLNWKESILIYIPGGFLWEGTNYEIPTFDEMKYKGSKNE